MDQSHDMYFRKNKRQMFLKTLEKCVKKFMN